MKNKKELEHKCPHDIDFSHEEDIAMRWLSETLTDTANRCGPNARIASVAHEAVGRILSNMHDLHTLVHTQEAELHAMDRLEKALADQMGHLAPEHLN